MSLSIPAADRPYGIVAADATGDGIPDIAGLDHLGNRLLIFPTAGPSIGASIVSPLSFGVQNSRLLRADVTGDGLPDLIAAGDAITLQVLTAAPVGSFVAGPVQVLGAAHYGLPGFIGHLALGIVDWDVDGLPDILGTAFNGPLAVFMRNMGAGTFAPGVSIQFQNASVGTLPPAFTDLDADGLPDLVSGLSIYFGTGSFESPAGVHPGGSPDLVQDADDDGDPDATFGAAAAWNDGRGVFGATAAALTLPPAPAGMFYATPQVIGDLDGDGRLDWFSDLMIPGANVFIPPTFVEVHRFADRGTGSLIDMGAAAAPGQTLPRGRAVDVDGDGDRDLAVASPSFMPIGTRIARNNGAGFFTSVVTLSNSWTARLALKVPPHRIVQRRSLLPSGTARKTDCPPWGASWPAT
jgi:hypothetical protein